MNTANWIDTLEDHIGDWAIQHITRGIVFLNVMVFILGKINPEFINTLILDPEAIMRGEAWRIVTFMFIPGTQNVIFVIFYLLLTWYIGDTLEEEWGAFKVNLFFIVGMISLAAVAFFVIKRQVDNVFLYSSLLIAFGTVCPRLELMLFPFPLPIQARFLAIFNGVLLAIYFILAPPLRLVILASVANYAVFFLPPAMEEWADKIRQKLHR